MAPSKLWTHYQALPPEVWEEEINVQLFRVFLDTVFSHFVHFSPCIRDFLKHKDGGKAIQLVAGNFTNKIPNFE